MSTTIADQSLAEWVNTATAAKVLGTDSKHVLTLAKRGFVGIRQLPGQRPRFNRADLERLAHESVRPARVAV